MFSSFCGSDLQLCPDGIWKWGCHLPIRTICHTNDSFSHLVPASQGHLCAIGSFSRGLEHVPCQILGAPWLTCSSLPRSPPCRIFGGLDPLVDIFMDFTHLWSPGGVLQTPVCPVSRFRPENIFLNPDYNRISAGAGCFYAQSCNFYIFFYPIQLTFKGSHCSYLDQWKMSELLANSDSAAHLSG